MPERRRVNQQQDDVWRKNAATLRRLYLEERRTLKAVKDAMENKHGFPVTPLSTYESKLRDLGLRKKMKRKDWHTVYQHYVQSGNRHTAIYFNGMRIPWEKAWKEIRRSGGKESIHRCAIELPVGVIMRSPSPVSHSIASLYEPVAPWDLSDMSLESLSPAAVTNRSKLYDIPSNLVRVEILSNYHKLFTGILTNTGESSLLHQSSTLSHQGSKDIDHSFDAARLSSALYKLTNVYVYHMHPYFPIKRLEEPLDVIVNLTPKQVLLNVLAGDSPTIQAALTNLLVLLGISGRKDEFVNLIEATWRFHPNWTLPMSCLEFAADFDCIGSCRTLLQMIPLDTEVAEFFTIIFNSVVSGHTDCAKTLFRYMVELSTTPEHIFRHEAFCHFLDAVGRGVDHHLRPQKYTRISVGNPAVLSMMEWFLDIGANVDLPAELSLITGYTKHTPNNWMPTILDHIYFLNSELYSLLIDHSVKSRIELTRPGIHHSASEGIDSLRTYLQSRPSHTPASQDMLVDIFLVEEILRGEHSNFEVIRTLLDYSPSFHTLDLSVSSMLNHCIRQAREQGIHPAVHHIVGTLTQSGATIDAKIMEQAVEREGTTLLQLLFSYGADFKSRGVLALCKAARIGNYDAVNWLLDMGVDIDSTLSDGWTILAQANQGDPMNCEMLEHLISRKVKLRAKYGDANPRQLLCLILSNNPYGTDWANIRKKVQLILDVEPLANEQPGVGPCPIEALLGQGIYTTEELSEVFSLVNYFLERGVLANNSRILADLVRHDAPLIEIQKALDSGADVNFYGGVYDGGYRVAPRYTPIQAAAASGSLHLVRFLIQKGADVNKPAKGRYGRTALQAACDVYRGSINVDLVKLLISNDADVNAPPAPVGGITALEGAAMAGSFEVALLLLENGADINAPHGETDESSALDRAVSSHHLDMVQFLLDLGALSHDRGESGYREAIRIAKEEENSAIANMIRRYALKNGKSGEELSADWDYAASENSSESDDLEEASSVEIWNQTSWEHWLHF
ncbi:hypothetical protein GGR51DRAFT_523061 [Nemania sp. FL0031]|nr:hypothetical protein GGR51DRAFT_523061 [Nemania sp. FL0031]